MDKRKYGPRCPFQLIHVCTGLARTLSWSSRGLSPCRDLSSSPKAGTREVRRDLEEALKYSEKPERKKGVSGEKLDYQFKLLAAIPLLSGTETRLIWWQQSWVSPGSPHHQHHRLRMLPEERGSKGGWWQEAALGKKRKEPQGCEEGERASVCPTQCPLLPHSTHPGPGALDTFPKPGINHLDIREAPMREGRKVGGTVSSFGEASQGVDLTGPSILVLPEIDGVRRIKGRVPVKEVVGSEEEAHTIPHSHRVGNVL